MPKTEKPKARVTVAKTSKIIQGRSTLRQKRLQKLIADNMRIGGKKSMGELLREAGYSESMANHPKAVIKGANFNEILEANLPDDEIGRIHGELLHASTMASESYDILIPDDEIIDAIESVPGQKLVRIEEHTTYGHAVRGKKREVYKRKIAYFTKPETQTRIKAVAEAYKIKNKYKPLDVKVTNKFTKESLDHIKLILGA